MSESLYAQWNDLCHNHVGDTVELEVISDPSDTETETKRFEVGEDMGRLMVDGVVEYTGHAHGVGEDLVVLTEAGVSDKQLKVESINVLD